MHDNRSKQHNTIGIANVLRSVLAFFPGFIRVGLEDAVLEGRDGPTLEISIQLR